MSETPPAGWYPDPSDDSRQRYWDGSAWTEHTAAGGQQPGGSPAWPQASPGGTPSSTSGYVEPPSPWLWQSIVATVLCCLPAGVVGIVFAAQSQSAAGRGDLDTARRKASAARTWTIASVVLGLLTVALVFSLIALGAIDAQSV